MSFVFASLFALALGAQQPTSGLDDLVAEALRRNPEIVAAQKKYEAARQRPEQESALPEPMVSLGYNSNGSPRPFAGIGREPTANAGVMLSQEFPWPGKRKLKGDIASREAGAAFEDYQAVQLSVVSRLKQAWHRLHHMYVSIETMERNREILRKFLRISEARYAVGRASQQDLFKAQAQISILETRLVRMEQDKESREAEINALLARSADAPVARPADVAPPELRVSLDELLDFAKRNSPMLRRDQKMVERAELAVNLARKEYYPDYTLNAGYFNMGSMPDMYMFRVDFKLPLYFFRKQRSGVAEQATNVSLSRRMYESDANNLAFRIRDDYLMAGASARLMKLYTDTVVPQAQLALESSLASYETGSVDFLTVLTNFMTTLEYELNYHEELMNFDVALARLEEMTGMKLF